MKNDEDGETVLHKSEAVVHCSSQAYLHHRIVKFEVIHEKREDHSGDLFFLDNEMLLRPSCLNCKKPRVHPSL
jgi:hypothetical protein